MAIRTVTRAGVGLVVGIILLGLLVLGGMWLVRERGEQARREEAINIADQQLKAASDDGVALNTDQAPADDDTSATPTQTDTSTTTSQPSSATELPQTGPGTTSIVVIGILSFAVASFVRSRQLVLKQL